MPTRSSRTRSASSRPRRDGDPQRGRPVARHVFAELHRVIRPDGLLLLAFQAGGFSVRHEQAYGHTVTFDAHRHDPDSVTAQLADAGLRVTVRTERAPQEFERTPQAFLLARRT